MDIIPARLKENEKRFKKHADKFKQIFGIDLSEFWDGIFALDVVSFDTWLKTPDNISTYEHIVNTYGEDAKNIVADLL